MTWTSCGLFSRFVLVFSLKIQTFGWLWSWWLWNFLKRKKKFCLLRNVMIRKFFPARIFVWSQKIKFWINCDVEFRFVLDYWFFSNSYNHSFKWNNHTKRFTLLRKSIKFLDFLIFSHEIKTSTHGPNNVFFSQGVERCLHFDLFWNDQLQNVVRRRKKICS